MNDRLNISGLAKGGGKGYGSVEVVTLDDPNGNKAVGHPAGEIGEVFDVTVTANHNFGGPAVTGQPFVIPGMFSKS